MLEGIYLWAKSIHAYQLGPGHFGTKNMQNKVKERMLIAIQQRKSDIIGTGEHISRGGLESHLQPI